MKKGTKETFIGPRCVFKARCAGSFLRRILLVFLVSVGSVFCATPFSAVWAQGKSDFWSDLFSVKVESFDAEDAEDAEDGRVGTLSNKMEMQALPQYFERERKHEKVPLFDSEEGPLFSKTQEEKKVSENWKGFRSRGFESDQMEPKRAKWGQEPLIRKDERRQDPFENRFGSWESSRRSREAVSPFGKAPGLE